MINIIDKSKCCGCTACVSVCNFNAITMKQDKMGFEYPVVDEQLCINCGLCEKVCTFKENYDIKANLPLPLAYAARHHNINEVRSSRSGAAFIAITDWVIDKGGVVYGVGYTDHFTVAHKRATTKEERNEFKGSKYVQSTLKNTFKQVKYDLQNQKIVLFSGTPCQTAGLKKIIGNSKLNENLILVDIVCHGVPAPYIWRDYLSYIEKKFHKKIIAVNFRDKRFGWKAHRETLTFEDQTILSPKYAPYTDLFYQHIMLRPSCSKCHFCNTKRPSDLTLADFWGWERTNKDLNKDNEGISLLLINTDKGRHILNYIKKDLYLYETTLEKCLQPNLISPSIFSTSYKKFEHEYIKYGFTYVLKKYTKIGFRRRCKVLFFEITHQYKTKLSRARSKLLKLIN